MPGSSGDKLFYQKQTKPLEPFNNKDIMPVELLPVFY